MSQALLYATIALLILVAIVSLDIMGFSFWKSNKFPVEGRTVILTGASQGMGKELTRILAERGANIILVARNVEKLQAAVEYAEASAKNPSTQRFHYISADVSSESENARLLAEATAWNNGKMPEIVWANAGSSTPGLFIECSMDTLRRQMDLDYFAAAILAHKTLRQWFYPEKPYSADAAPEPPRHFIITSSALAFANVAGYSSYSPAKAALRSLADGLRHEVLLYNGARRSKNKSTGQVPAPFDVHIHGIYPGSIRSPGFENENKTKHPVTFQLEESDPVQSEAEAAMGALRGLENGNFMTPTSWFVQVMRLGMLGGAPRDNIIRDTLGAWLITFVWLFVGVDLDGKVFGWGKKEGMPVFRENAQ